MDDNFEPTTTTSDAIMRGSAHSSIQWPIMGKRFPRSEVVFFSQMAIVTIVIIGAVYNLTVGHDNPTLWTALLSSCLGYILPHTSMQRPSRSI